MWSLLIKANEECRENVDQSLSLHQHRLVAVTTLENYFCDPNAGKRR
jgi:hypothetical protein